jgi:poly-gamma-glutamate capsule biosynthesis protein CapA/YwtB (metallophosphatase superfamily)
MGEILRLFVCGDVMPGRGVDQILAHPGDPRLREEYIHDARSYVRAAENAHGWIPRPVSFDWPWGECLWTLDDLAPQVRVINLESSITHAEQFAPEKAVHYRMNPANLPCLAAGEPDACALANNHVLDFGRRGLEQTLDALEGAGLRPVGAGRDAEQAQRPAVVPVGQGRRVLIFAYGAASSGIPSSWAATSQRPGVNFLPDLSEATGELVADRIHASKKPEDIVVVSLHWGANWAEDVPTEQVRFAHRLIDGGADIIHGHSSHHPRPFEVYRNKLILYGCGDFIDDYEGIPGHERFRHNLRVLYFPAVHTDTGELIDLRMVPMRSRRMRLHHASRADSRWLRTFHAGHHLAGRVDVEPDGTIVARGA